MNVSERQFVSALQRYRQEEILCFQRFQCNLSDSLVKFSNTFSISCIVSMASSFQVPDLLIAIGANMCLNDGCLLRGLDCFCVSVCSGARENREQTLVWDEIRRTVIGHDLKSGNRRGTRLTFFNSFQNRVAYPII